ncbi:MAG: hypothetical protein QN174_00170 [Armatimonadota bacterium]|nr:hypothetical protein [Armatimonadota bacterium]MDR7421435.1 hypothetical protein [Armatimonadota bacterium]MDR7454965.1 hypothetical protein [Armatimonadota bacterium]MDR7456077.1 hypothetical protein [Armatimonadota bacterium]MDR7495361.1 hypothetical protein [Armatimonadota bacterium]
MRACSLAARALSYWSRVLRQALLGRGLRRDQHLGLGLVLRAKLYRGDDLAVEVGDLRTELVDLRLELELGGNDVGSGGAHGGDL